MLLEATPGVAQAQSPFRERLKALPYKIAFESYVADNWEIWVMNADGSNPVNLTRTPKVQEHYPQVSPDGTRIAFSVDTGEGRDTVRSLWVMDVDGKNRKKLVDSAREPFWSPDGKVIGFLPQEYPKFNVVDFSTKGMSFYHLDSGKIEAHPNTEKLFHLYNPSFSKNGKWIAATVHAGMGVDHAILLIEAKGDKIINLKIPGCRPWLSPDANRSPGGQATTRSRRRRWIRRRRLRWSARGGCGLWTRRTRFTMWTGRRTAAFCASAGGRTARGT